MIKGKPYNPSKDIDNNEKVASSKCNSLTSYIDSLLLINLQLFKDEISNHIKKK